MQGQYDSICQPHRLTGELQVMEEMYLHVPHLKDGPHLFWLWQADTASSFTLKPSWVKFQGVYESHTGCPCHSVEWCLMWILTLSESLPFDVECADWITGGAEKYMNLLGISNELCVILRKYPIRFPSEQTHQRLGKSGTQHSTVDGSWKFS